MRTNIYSVVMVVLVSLLGGCNQSTTETSQDPPTSGETASDVATAKDSIDLSAEAPAADSPDQRIKQRIGGLFERVLPTLDEARGLVDRHASLPDNSRIPFRTDKLSNTAEINELLDEAIVILSDSEANDYRQQIRQANASIADARTQIAEYRQQRVSAPRSKDQSQIDKVNPFSLSKEELDDAIKEQQSRIEQEKETLIALKKTFAEEMTKIGVDVDQAGVETLLNSVSGDDIVTMAVVFDNIKHLTLQLEKLTEESGEALDVSKRYYGMYVVMVHIMDRIQKTFVKDINEQHIPKLNEFIAQADKNIKDAEKLIKSNSGDKRLLESNIASNRVTRQTAGMYIEHLKSNAELIAAENERAQKNIATAMNTYETVKLSSDVATLMKTGRRDFETLMRLKVPSLREFSNDAMRREFQRMTSELREGS